MSWGPTAGLDSLTLLSLFVLKLFDTVERTDDNRHLRENRLNTLVVSGKSRYMRDVDSRPFPFGLLNGSFQFRVDEVSVRILGKVSTSDVKASGRCVCLKLL